MSDIIARMGKKGGGHLPMSNAIQESQADVLGGGMAGGKKTTMKGISDDFKALQKTVIGLNKEFKGLSDVVGKLSKSISRGGAGGGGGGAGGIGPVGTGGGGGGLSGSIAIGSILAQMAQWGFSKAVNLGRERMGESISRTANVAMNPAWLPRQDPNRPAVVENYTQRFGRNADYGGSTFTKVTPAGMINPQSNFMTDMTAFGFTDSANKEAMMAAVVRSGMSPTGNQKLLPAAMSRMTGASFESGLGLYGALRGAGMGAASAGGLMGRMSLESSAMGFGGDRSAVLMEKMVELLGDISESGEKGLESTKTLIMSMRDRGLSVEEALRAAGATREKRTMDLAEVKTLEKLGAGGDILLGRRALAAAQLGEEEAQKYYGGEKDTMQMRDKILSNASKMMGRSVKPEDMKVITNMLMGQGATDIFGKSGRGKELAFMTAPQTGFFPGLSRAEQATQLGGDKDAVESFLNTQDSIDSTLKEIDASSGSLVDFTKDYWDKMAALGGEWFGVKAEQGMEGISRWIKEKVMPGGVGSGGSDFMPTVSADKQSAVDMAYAAEEKYGIPKGAYVGLIDSESAFRNVPNAQGSGAAGIAQFTQRTWKSRTGRPIEDRYNVPAALDEGAKYFKELLDRNRGDVAGAIRSYKGVSVGGATEGDVKRAVALGRGYSKKLSDDIKSTGTSNESSYIPGESNMSRESLDVMNRHLEEIKNTNKKIADLTTKDLAIKTQPSPVFNSSRGAGYGRKVDFK